MGRWEGGLACRGVSEGAVGLPLSDFLIVQLSEEIMFNQCDVNLSP